MDLRDRAWPVLRKLMAGHTTVYKLSGGVIGHRIPGAPPTLLLDHVGAKSGQKRTSPLAYIPDADSYVLVASKGGFPKHPAWFHNLKANPETRVQIGHSKKTVLAHVASPEERARLWPMITGTYPIFAGYQERTEREIPLIVLEPKA